MSYFSWCVYDARFNERVLIALQLPKDNSLPPVVWHWIPWFGSAAGYGEDPIKFFFDCKEKVCMHAPPRCALLTGVQYGNVFTFILMGRRVTVALTPAGNNFIMGGKHTTFSAEDVYTVRNRTLFL